jgi:hypothetical protein
MSSAAKAGRQPFEKRTIPDKLKIIAREVIENINVSLPALKSPDIVIITHRLYSKQLIRLYFSATNFFNETKTDNVLIIELGQFSVVKGLPDLFHEARGEFSSLFGVHNMPTTINID